MHANEVNSPHPKARPSSRIHRVVLVSHGFQTNYERGFCNGLAENACDVTLISSDRTDRSGIRKEVHCVNLRGSQEERRPRWVKAFNLIRYHFRLLAYAFKCRRDVLHVIGLLDPVWLGGLLEGLWFRLWCRSYVLTVHNLVPHDRDTAFNRTLYRWAYRLPDLLVAHTRRMREELVRDYGVSRDRIRIMEHGIEPWGDGDEPIAESYVRGTPLRLLFFGKVAPYKGLDLLLDALETSANSFELTVAGVCGDPMLEKALRAQITTHRLAARIHWRNEFVAEAAVANLFLSHDALVLPYRHIDQSGVLFQALRYGLPMVVSRVGSLECYVTEQIGELCQPDNPDDLRDALDRMFERRATMSRKIITEFGRRFFWTNTVLPLFDVYATQGP